MALGDIPAPTPLGFNLAEPVVKILSNGAVYVKFKGNPANFAPVTVYNAKDGMVATHSENTPANRYVHRDGQLYTIDDESRGIDIRPDDKFKPFFVPGGYTFAGNGEEEWGGKILSYEDAMNADGMTLRLMFDGGQLAAIRVKQAESEGFSPAFPFVLDFGGKVKDSVFEIPEGYTVRKSIEQMKEDAKRGIEPDDPVDRLALQMSLSEDERLEKEKKERA
jgi:hypothetical protein